MIATERVFDDVCIVDIIAIKNGYNEHLSHLTSQVWDDLGRFWETYIDSNSTIDQFAFDRITGVAEINQDKVLSTLHNLSPDQGRYLVDLMSASTELPLWKLLITKV
jgi:hypothetical protein